MDDIVEAAGMPAGGVYGYLPGKDAVITAIAEEVVGGLTSTLTALLAQDEVPFLSGALRQLVVQIDALAGSSSRPTCRAPTWCSAWSRRTFATRCFSSPKPGFGASP
jgi:AcrR family transcriptional regulator